MRNLKSSENWAFSLAVWVILIACALFCLVEAKVILAPLAFGIITATLVHPLVRFLEKARLSVVWAATVVYLMVLSSLTGLILYFSNQVFLLFSEVQDFQSKIGLLIDRCLTLINRFMPLRETEISSWLIANKSTVIKELSGVIANTIHAGSDLIGFISLTLIFSFFTSIYSKSLVQFILAIAGDAKRHSTWSILLGVKAVIKNYFLGMLTVMILIGILNTIGLSLIGIEYAFLFGFLASFLTIIPYVGTTLGYTLPFLYALVSYPNAIWKALAVVFMTVLIQQLEANLITPRIVGNKVSINAFVAFLALLFGGLLWGIAGMIVSIPTVAVIKVVLENINGMSVYAHFLSQDFPDKPFTPK